MTSSGDIGLTMRCPSATRTATTSAENAKPTSSAACGMAIGMSSAIDRWSLRSSVRTTVMACQAMNAKVRTQTAAMAPSSARCQRGESRAENRSMVSWLPS